MIREWLIDYSNDVLSNEVIACVKHKQACSRFLNDVKREGTDDFPYIFDEEKAIRFLNWMGLFKHTKGVLAKQNIVPADIQAFIFSNIYGWVHKDSKLRRFRKAYWQVGRKNAKSQSLACVGSYEEMALGENMSEVYVGATKTEQSKIVLNETKAQLRACPDLKGKYNIAYGKIEHPKSGSYMVALSKDDGKTGDGLNVQCGIIDEYHAHKTSEIYDVLASGMGARLQPLMMIITTAGFELNNPCYAIEYKYVSKILDPNDPIDNDEYFVMINELDKNDDIKNEKNWSKANPILCSYEGGVIFLRGELKAALGAPEKMRNFLTKNMNIWVDQKDNGYMSMGKWADCKKELPDLKGCSCYVGVDLSAKLDLTSVSFEFTIDDKYVILSHSFMPEERLVEKRNTDRVPYDLWVNEGWITVMPGAVIDYRFVAKYMTDQLKQNDWIALEICFDPWSATQISNDLTDDGYTCIEIVQGMKTLSEPTKDFREAAYNKRVIHDGNPVLGWAISNAVTRMDHNENMMLDKAKSTQRIDPIASVINAHVRAIAPKEEDEPSIYESRGLLSY